MAGRIARAPGGPWETVPVRTNDEVGELATAFNQMIARLNEARVGLERRRHDGEAEIRPYAFLELSHHGERDVALQVPLVELVEDDDADTLEEGIGREEPAEDPLGHEPQPGPGAAALLEAHAVAHLLAERTAALAGDVRRRRARRDPPWLEDEDVPIAGEARIEERRGHARRLAGAGGGAEDEAGRAAEARHGVGEEGVDREGLHGECRAPVIRRPAGTRAGLFLACCGDRRESPSGPR